MKKILALLTTLVFVIVIFPSYSDAVVFTPNFTIASDVAVLINLDKDVTIYEKNPTKKSYPASLTKIVTAMVVLDHVTDFENTKFEAPLVVFDDLYGKGASSIGYSRGEVISVDDLMYSMLLHSACESAGILAYHVGGESIPNFVNMMNEKVKEIGCSGTNFVNPHGLYDDNQYTNGRDMALIAKYAVQNYSKFLDYATETEYTLGATNYNAEGWATVRHTNRMLTPGSDYYYKYAKGIKTGTESTGRNLVSMASKDGSNYLFISMGAPLKDADGNNVNYQFEDHKNVYEWAFDTFSYKKLLSKEQEITEIPVLLGEERDYVLLTPSEEYSAMWPSTLDVSNIKTEIDVTGYVDETGSIVAPVETGKVMGKYTLSLSGEVLFETDLIVKDGVSLSKLEYNIMKAKEFVKSDWFKIAIGAAAALIVFYIIIYIIATKKKKRRSSNKSVSNKNKRKF